MRSARLALLAVLLLAVSSAFAQHAAKGKPKSDDAPSATQQAAPADNNLRPPTKEEVQELAAGLERSVSQPTEGLRQLDGGDGIVGVDLDGTHENVALARRNPDGSLSLQCVETSKQAKEFLAGNPPKNSAEKKKTPAPPAAPVEEK